MLIDSNILIYSIDVLSEKHSSSREFLQVNLKELCISHQNILESYRIITHNVFRSPMDSKKAIKFLDDFAKQFTILYPTRETIDVFIALVKKYSITSNNTFDAYLVATMLSHSVKIIATNNVKHFSFFEEIKIINPFK